MSTAPVSRMPQGPTMTTAQFASKIKAKYPQYQSIPDAELTRKVIAKHPVYGQMVFQHSEGGVTPTPSKAIKAFDALAQGAVNHASVIGGTLGAIVGAEVGGVAGGVRGATIGGGAGEALKEAANTGKIDPYKTLKSAATMGGAEYGFGLAAKGIGAAVRAIPLKSRGSELLEGVMKEAKDVPVELKNTSEPLLRAHQLASRGGTVPTSINKLLRRVTDPEGKPLTYEEARDFYKNLSRKLSPEESAKLPAELKYRMSLAAKALHQDIGDAAARVNKAAEYYAGMKEYSKAAILQKHAQNIGKFLLRAVGVGAGADMVYQAGKAVVKK